MLLFFVFSCEFSEIFFGFGEKDMGIGDLGVGKRREFARVLGSSTAIPEFLEEKKFPASYFTNNEMMERLKAFSINHYKDNLIENCFNQNVFLIFNKWIIYTKI